MSSPFDRNPRAVLGVKDMVNILLSLTLTAPLVIGTGLFLMRGDFLFAAVTAILAVIAFFLPTIILRKFRFIDVVPSFLRRPIMWVGRKKP